jgi:fibronectin type 3 domain-containing protein
MIPAFASESDIVPLVGQTPDTLTAMRTLGVVASSQPMALALVLPIRNEDELSATLRDLYSPTSPSYHQFLSPAQFTADYGPTAEQYAAVEQFAKANGLTVTGTHSNRLVLDVAGSAGAFEKAFHINLMKYQASDGRIVFGPDGDPLLPASVVANVSAIVGLDNATLIHPHYVQRQIGKQTKMSIKCDGSGPSGTIEPTDIRAAYNTSTVSNPGSGQVLALMELDGYTAGDVTKYETQFGLPKVTLQNVLLDGFNGQPSGNGGEMEVTLDIELDIALAPSISKIMVYEAPNTFQGLTDCYCKIADDDSAKQISSSWGLPEIYAGSELYSEWPLFEQMAAEGQSMYAAAGDSGAYDAGNGVLGVDDPASQPYVCGVGGTTLTTNSNQAYVSETTWRDGGGGESVEWPKPSYQTGYGLSPTMRDVPDVSLNADPNTGYIIYVDGGWYEFGGTSCAAPLWASFTAIVNQARVAKNLSPLGFPNPALYNISEGPDYTTDFHDIADNSTNGYYIAVPGYDDASGLGSFNGLNLLADLSSANPPAPNEQVAPTNIASASTSSSSMSVTWTAAPRALGYDVLRSTSTAGPYSLIGTSTSTNYTDSTAASGATYTYVLTAYGPDGFSPNSTTSNATQAPAPSNLAATATSASGITLTWTGVSNAASYSVKRGTSATGTFAAIGSPTSATYNDSGLSAGTTYYYEVTALVGGAASAASNVANATTIAAAPTSPLAKATSSSAITVTWTASTGATGYNVLRGTSNSGPFTAIGSTSSGAVSMTTYSDAGLSAATAYYYVVQATDSGGTSGNSAVATATTLTAGPTGLTATAASTSQINLSWTASKGATSYSVLRGSASGGPYSAIGTSSTTSYSNTGLTGATTYYYVVAAVASGGASADSNQASATTMPSPPSGLSAGAVSAGAITLTWTTVSGATGYNVLRGSASAGPFSKIGTATTGTYPDANLAAATAYYYVVQTVASSGTSANSSVATATTLSAPPTNLAATAVSATQINLTWTAAKGATSYAVLAGSSSGGPYTSVGTATTTTFSHTGLTGLTTYYYVVEAKTSGGASANSNVASATTLPGPPSGLSAKATSAGSIALTWTAVSNSAKSKTATSISYNVLRGTSSGGPFTKIGTAATATYTDTNLTALTTYYYVVELVTQSGTSGNSSPASATTFPAAPTNLTAKAASSTQINLTWTASKGATSYAILRGSSNTGAFSSVGTSTTTSYSNTGLTASTTYVYVVEAVTSSGASANSNTASATTSMPAPTGLAVSAASNSEIVVTWTAYPNSNGYEVYRGTVHGGPYTAITSDASAKWIDTGLKASTAYYYVVTATTSAGTSPYSSEATATTLVNPPSAPTNLTATASSSTALTLKWTAASGATSYTVYRATSAAGTFSSVGTATTTSFVNSGLSNATYYYCVTASNAGGMSAASNIASGKP